MIDHENFITIGTSIRCGEMEYETTISMSAGEISDILEETALRRRVEDIVTMAWRQTFGCLKVEVKNNEIQDPRSDRRDPRA